MAIGRHLVDIDIVSDTLPTEPAHADLAFWKQALADAIAIAREPEGVTRAELAIGLGALADRAARLDDGMRFESLYDRRRRMFTIGYRLADADGPGRADGSFYDLLASEAQLASFVAIAKGDVPEIMPAGLPEVVPPLIVSTPEKNVVWSLTLHDAISIAMRNSSIMRTLSGQSVSASSATQFDPGILETQRVAAFNRTHC